MCDRILAIDYGRKRIGLARSDELCTIAIPLEALDNSNSTLEQIVKIVKETGIKKILIGIPRRISGEEGELAEEIREFARSLEEKLQSVKIIFWDESLTSKEAEKIFIQKYKRLPVRQRDKKVVDSYAAAIMLEEYLNAIKGEF
ncbi:MAG: Holliday junction resolvase RuvX [Candidatus Hydrothermia bacterium]